MRIAFDPEKRQATLDERGLDFRDAAHVFAGYTEDRVDDRKDYGERRVISAGLLAGQLVVIVWTRRGTARRIISMRKANAKENRLWLITVGSRG